MTEQEKQVREQLQRETKTGKSVLFKEELASAFYALCFGMNAAVLVAFPFTIVSVLNIAICGWVLTKFKGTVKRQIQYDSALKSLAEIKKELDNPKKDKVWKQ